MTLSLFLGDCTEGMTLLDDQSIDVTITDPPYEDEAHNKHRRARDVKAGLMHAPLPFASMTPELRAAAAEQIVRVTRRWVVVFCQVEAVHLWRAVLEQAGARYIRTCIWDKPDGSPQFTGDRPGMGYESIVVAHVAPGRMRWNGGGKRGVYRHQVRTSIVGRAHSTQKPLPLMRELVADFSDPGEVVLDPFAGQATTGVACRALGRGFIGYEADPDMWERGSRALVGERAKDIPTQPTLL